MEARQFDSEGDRVDRINELCLEGLTKEEAEAWADTPFSAKDILFYMEDGIRTPADLSVGEAVRDLQASDYERLEQEAKDLREEIAYLRKMSSLQGVWLERWRDRARHLKHMIDQHEATIENMTEALKGADREIARLRKGNATLWDLLELARDRARMLAEEV
jgi:uncharacterized protein YukE